MASLEYLAPTSVAEAVKALAAAGPAGRPLAGGTDLIVQMRSGRARPGLIVDLKKLPGAIGIRREADGGFTIGAATPGAVLGENAALEAAWPGVVEAAGLIGSTQIQGRGSMGGNLCNASPAADSVPALVAARAIAVIAGPEGTRQAPVETIPTGPGTTSLGAGEFLLALRLPPRPKRAADAYLRSIPRTEMDIAVVGAGVSLILDEQERIAELRLALGAVAPTVITVDTDRLLGAPLESAALERLDALARAACRPISDRRGTAEYRSKVAGVLARRAAAIALERARNR